MIIQCNRLSLIGGQSSRTKVRKSYIGQTISQNAPRTPVLPVLTTYPLADFGMISSMLYVFSIVSLCNILR